MESGAESSSGRVRARRSSLIERMVSSGITSSSTMVALEKSGATMTSVAPGGLSIVAICAW